MKRKLRLSIVLAIGISTCAGTVVADEEFDPRPLIEGRQAALRDIGAAFKAINDELKKPAPSLPSIRYSVRQIEELSKQQSLWFPAGTGPESEIGTAAKPEIWKQPAEFTAQQAAFRNEVTKLSTIATGSDAAAIKAQWQALGKTCKSCHEKFRNEDD